MHLYQLWSSIRREPSQYWNGAWTTLWDDLIVFVPNEHSDRSKGALRATTKNLHSRGLRNYGMFLVEDVPWIIAFFTTCKRG